MLGALAYFKTMIAISAAIFAFHAHHVFHMEHLAHMHRIVIMAEERKQVIVYAKPKHVTIYVAAPAPAPGSYIPDGTLSCNGLEQLWESAGGNFGEAFIAAEIAMAESGGNQYAVSPTDDYGYWQINMPSWGPGMATFDPIGNAKAAIQISSNGTDWSAWTTYTSGAYYGRC